MMRNPHAMQQMMRSQDLAMSQIENLPGGFNALRRMYEDVHEPMMNAMQQQTQTQTQNMWGAPHANLPGVSPPSSSSGPNNAALPNPW